MEKLRCFPWTMLFGYAQEKKGLKPCSSALESWRMPIYNHKRRTHMRSTKWKRRAVVQGLILAVGVGTVYADAPAPKWYDTIGLSGYLQSSYVGNLEIG